MNKFSSIFTSLLILASLNGCGGGDSSTTSSQSEVSNTNELNCNGEVEIPFQDNHPVFRIENGDSSHKNKCDIFKYYKAGYAVVMPHSMSPWNLNQSSAINISYSESDAMLLDGSINQEEVAAAEPAEIDSETLVVVAKILDSELESTPWNCAVSGVDANELESNLQLCLSELNSKYSEHKTTVALKGLSESSPADTSKGGANPGAVWTNLGTSSYITKSDGLVKRFSSKKEVVHTGSANFDVYRLNGVDSFEYYLVRAKIGSNPTSVLCTRWIECAYFNNKESLRFHLKKVTNGVASDGIIEEFAPLTTLRNKSTSFKIGAGIKASASDKGPGGEGSVSADFSVSYSYSAVEIKAAQIDNSSVKFDFGHATGDGYFGDLWDKDPTTVGPFTSTVWAIFKFPATSKVDKSNSIISLYVDEYSGKYGYSAPGLIPIASTKLFKYEVKPKDKEGLKTDFSLPKLTVQKVSKNEDGSEKLDPVAPENLLKIKKGQTLQFDIDSGGLGGATSTSTPLIVNWAIYSPPSFLAFSQATGRGKSRIHVTVNSGGVIGDRSYIRINASPRGAIPGLEMTDISVPIEVIE